jgi:aryl-alcohol dehydrogenase-like predicted oxidoreductase
MTRTVADNSRKSPSWQASSDSMASALGTPYKRNAIMETIKTQGVDIPRLGFGTFRMPDGEAQPVVESAITLSFRHIDTAVIDKNATAVGAAIAALGVNRAKLFVAIKVGMTNSRPMPCAGHSTSALVSSGSTMWTST